ncbi:MULTISPECIES: hypothetical protein [Hymenobacter]|uniref:hypothetical protein n=1 Tax=Hymenobacter TaxID=89966 RepID=UPI001058A549|nr:MULTISPECIES: hypothetical protein [Hymenobacter]QIL78292.1 hypothetical protein G7064_20950 [Hymenobacter sp. HDW8]
MIVRALIRQSERQFDQQPRQVQPVFSPHLFTLGARWMFSQLPVKEPTTAYRVDASPNFGWYGCFKYGLSLLAFAASGWALGHISLLLTPLAVLGFYVMEVHFLFLFPLLLDGAQNPLRTSMKATYRIGLLSALLGVLPIGGYMLSGLLNRQQPFRRWHIGCLAVLLWYQDEVRDRL